MVAKWEKMLVVAKVLRMAEKKVDLKALGLAGKKVVWKVV